jgi:pyridoxamine 5'-phosphate oxidase
MTTDRADAGYADRRESYDAGTLTPEDLAATPLAQFEQWYADAAKAAVPEPNAMVLATADAAGAPSARIVLLKAADPRGFAFYTNQGSRKGRELAVNPAVALLFPWHGLQRQVSVRGRVEVLPREETQAYFGSRPWGSRIGAWASRQSQPVADRAVLEERWALLAARWPDHGRPDDVPVPDHWGGYLVRAGEVEFWQGRPSRLHDRLVFLPVSHGADGAPPALDDAAGWRVERREP